jgi:Fe-S oxidoreductase
MHIDNDQDVISACRFCFMCRHLDPVANVTFREADTPRGRALICDKIRMDREFLKNQDFIDTLYRSALSAANRYHCVSHYDETGLVLAARKDIVEAGLAPEKVTALAKTLEKVSFSIKGKGSVLYFGEKPELYPGCKVITGKDPGKALEVLGFAQASRVVLDKFAKAVEASKCKTLVVAEPSAYDFLTDKLAGVKVVHCAEHLLGSDVKPGRARKAVYLESDFLKNYCGNPSAPRDLLKKAGYALLPFGTNDEESYAVGEGAVVYDALNPQLCEKLCVRVAEQAKALKKPLFITASQYVRDALRKYNPTFNIVTLEDAFLSFTLGG